MGNLEMMSFHLLVLSNCRKLLDNCVLIDIISPSALGRLPDISSTILEPFFPN